MPQIAFIRDLVIIFGLSVAVVLVFHRLRLPSIVGFLITGILVGPYGLNLINDLQRVKVFAEVGVVLLLFTIGLEFSLTRLSRIRTFAVSGGALQVGLTIAVTAFAGFFFFQVPPRTAIFWGFLLALSSTVIVLKILMERGELDAPHGRLAIAILIFQDLVVVPMMMIMPLLGGEALERPFDVVWTLARSVLLIGAILIAARWLIPKALSLVVRARSRELFVITVILICAGIAWLAEENGLSLALGAFIAGLVISESDYGHQALSDIMPFRDSFNSLFFVSIGMLLDVRIFSNRLPFILLLTIAVLLLKGAVAGGITLGLGYPLRIAALVGLSLPQVGEFSFVLAQAGRGFGLLTENGYQLFLVISILTMIVAPFLIQLGPRISRQTEAIGGVPSWLRRKRPLELEPDAPLHRNHVIIAGYGLNGRNLARVLKEVKIPYVILDLHAETVRHGRSHGEPLYYGDATQSEVLRQMQIKDARVLVLAVSDPFAARRAIQVARHASPQIHIVVRTRYVTEVDELLRLGANVVVPEEFETSLEIFDLVLQQYQVPARQIARKKEEVRRAGYAKLRREEIEEYLGQGELPAEVEAEYYPLKADSSLVGKTLLGLPLPVKSAAHAAAIIRRGETHPSPVGSHPLGAGDTLVLIGTREELDEAIHHLEACEEEAD
jgi:K+:H+ antiporter